MNAKDDDGNTPLHILLKRRAPDMLENLSILTQHSVIIDQTNNDCITRKYQGWGYLSVTADRFQNHLCVLPTIIFT